MPGNRVGMILTQSTLITTHSASCDANPNAVATAFTPVSGAFTTAISVLQSVAYWLFSPRRARTMCLRISI